MRSTLKKEEILLIIIRQHWIKLVLPVLCWVAAVVLLLLFAPPKIALITGLISALYPFYLYLDWKSNLWCVTNLRVVDENGYFTRYSKESPLDKINNVEYDQSFMGRMIGYGDVRIQTAAEMGDTTYKLIHYPKELKDTITLAQEEYKNLQIANQAKQFADAVKSSIGNGLTNHTVGAGSPTLIAAELEKLFELMQKGAISREEYEGQKARLLR